MRSFEIEEQRRKADEAMAALKGDLERLKAALGATFSLRAIIDRYPLAVVGTALGTGLLIGFRGRKGPAEPAASTASFATGGPLAGFGAVVARQLVGSAIREGAKWIGARSVAKLSAHDGGREASAPAAGEGEA
jgi:hypothetical protein